MPRSGRRSRADTLRPSAVQRVPSRQLADPIERAMPHMQANAEEE